MSFDDGTISAGGLSQENHRALVRELQSFLPNAKDSGLALTLSRDPASWVEIAASVNTFVLVFGPSAAILLKGYLEGIASKAADATPGLIRQFISALRRFAGRARTNLHPRLKIPGPGVYFTTLWLSPDDEERCCRDLALFVEHLPTIERAANGLPITDLGLDVTVRMDEDSFELEWLSRSTSEVHTLTFTFHCRETQPPGTL